MTPDEKKIEIKKVIEKLSKDDMIREILKRKSIFIVELNQRKNVCRLLCEMFNEKPTYINMRAWASLLRWGNLRLVTSNEYTMERRMLKELNIDDQSRRKED
jgi:hypothetical protein